MLGRILPALTPSSLGKDLGPVLEPRVPQRPSPIAGGIRTFTLARITVRTSLSLNLHRSRSKDMSQSYHSRERTGHPHQRQSRSSAMEKKHTPMIGLFQQSGTSNQGSFSTSHDRDSSDTLFRWGRYYKDALSLPRIPRRNRASPPLRASSPSAALGALPKGSPNCPDRVHSPQCWMSRSKLQRKGWG